MAMYAPGPAPHDPRGERRGRRLEIWSAILLGIAAVATAWGAYMAALLDGDALQGYSTANTLTSQVAEAYGEGDTQKAFDQTVYLAYIREMFAGDPDGLARYIREDLTSEQLAAALDWFNDTPDEVTSPFDTEAGSPYGLPGYTRGNAYAEEARAAYAEAVEADDAGDGYELGAVMLAIALFFGGIANVFRSPAPQVAVLGVGTVALTGGLAQLVLAGL